MKTGRAGVIDSELTPEYFLDTYAMMEYVGGNRAYLKYFSSASRLRTSILNLMELYFHVLRDAGEDAADSTYAQFKQYVVQLSDEDVKNGMKFRLRSMSKRLDVSYTDAVGFATSERLGTKFLTGDEAFKRLPNVEFVK
jgi:predicted nucleic acid-binding protein